MRFITYSEQGQMKVGAVRDGGAIDLSALAPSMLALIEQGSDGRQRVEAYLEQAETTVALDSVTLLAPIPAPRRNVMCLGLNYAEHAEEHYAVQGRQSMVPDTPVIFTKASTAANGPYGDIPFDPAVGNELDWEAELAFVIGRQGKNISAAEAMSYVYGYMVLNDVSARDFQRRGKQYFKGKSLDGACPMGPWIVTADELSDPGSLRITSRVNGVTKQDSSTARMIFNIPAIIAYLSQGMTLLPGDIVATGTPSGVGFARTPPEFLRPGDVVECEIERIGVIRNQVRRVTASE